MATYLNQRDGGSPSADTPNSLRQNKASTVKFWLVLRCTDYLAIVDESRPTDENQKASEKNRKINLGSLTQLVECLLCKQDVRSSILLGSTIEDVVTARHGFCSLRRQ